MAQILFFGRLGERAGGQTHTVSLPPDVMTTEDVRRFVAVQFPDLVEDLAAPSVRIAVNREIVLGKAPVSDADEIAFLPPFSGG